MKRILSTVLGLGFSVFSFAQDNEHRNWGTLNINQKLDDKWSFNSDVQYRTYEDFDQLNQLLIRAGIGYDLSTNNNTILAGYAFVINRNSTSEDNYSTSNEHRIYQQFNTKHKISIVNLNHRFRFEERLMNDDIFFRFRYQINATIPLNKPSIQNKTIYFKLANELFLNTIKTNDFDRNRLNLSLGYVVNPTLTIESGYMKQHVKHQQTDHFTFGITLNNLL